MRTPNSHRAKNRSRIECGWKDGARGGPAQSQKIPGKEKKNRLATNRPSHGRTWPSETSRFLSQGSRPYTAAVINLHIDFSVRLRLVLTEGHFPSSRWKGRIGSHSHR
jgi:hypothetical protein